MSNERFLVGGVETLGDREVGIIAATSQLARDGHVLEPSGIDLTSYRKNPIVLWSHQPEQPIGVCTAIAVRDNQLAARIEFAPAGLSDIADEICALVKAGVVRGVSIGFNPTESEPLDPRSPRGGQHITGSEMLEVSFVSVPADTGAGVVARSFNSRPGAATLLRSLPAISSGAIQRARDEIERFRDGRPYYLLSTREKFEIDRQRTMTTWAIGQAREAEDYARRQADLRTLGDESTH